MNLSAKKLCSVLKGRFIRTGDGVVQLKGVSIDSRERSLTGKIFFAIRGARFNGHNFLTKALTKGAKALVTDQKFSDWEGLFASSPNPVVIQVPDTLKALQALASYWRKKNNFQVIGITGSAGKTTTKFFCQTLLEKSFVVQASPKSFNNHYGVPLSLLSANQDTNFLIQEIGMNQVGEIASLSRLADPDIVTVTQVGDSHIGILKGKANIAHEKEQIYLTCPKALPVFNKDNPWTKAMYERWKKHQPVKKTALVFSAQDKKADIFLTIKKKEATRLFVSGHIQGVKGNALLPITGSIHLNNIMCAGALALAGGLKELEIWERFSLCQLPPGRNQWIKLSCGAKVLFDAYNASPESVMALLKHFLSPIVKGKKVLVLGDFLELGGFLEDFQKKVAEFVTTKEVSLVWLIGQQADSLAKALKQAGCSSPIYTNKRFNSKRAKHIKACLKSNYVLAFKGSRKNQLEKVLKHFEPLTWPVF